MKKRLVFLLSLILIVSLPAVTYSETVTYQQARENIDLREDYLEQVLEDHPPPENFDRVRYVNQAHESATMTINYLPYNIGDREIFLNFSMVVYQQAFDHYEKEDTFKSTLYHEYNHIRALRRIMDNDYILNEDKNYMEVQNISQVQLGSEKQSPLSLDSSMLLNPNVNFKLKWSDLFNSNNYDSDLISEDEEASARLILRSFIVTHVLEMLAIEEEIHLHRTRLNPCQSFRDSRYEMYAHHYLELLRGLSSLDASEELTQSLNSIFYRSWVRKEIKNFDLVFSLYN